MFRSAEEKESERQAREAARAREEQEAQQRRRAVEAERHHAAFLASPLGRATAARDAGDRFLELQLEVGARTGDASFGQVTTTGSVGSSAQVLAEVEDVGWRLEHASYFFVVTSQTSTDRVFLSGENTAVQGVTMGAYLFRRSPTAAGGPTG
ncbi:hypothetical protein RKE38_11070 [Phycicoccus sp. M110.8]|uniref:hypothetical protein n=1 Tax=Phycicoccus sp. M110.8 TaxID=3075433 RepID=UPI0028FD6C92|nr:hypothetical protein [Phycicoccus sp. M110.8]MDU0314228.1 hypothetical protein [Phycicoccus sp. M110.8]